MTIELSCVETSSDSGFTGTVSEFLAWVGIQLPAADIHIGEPMRNPQEINPIYRVREVVILAEDSALLQQLITTSPFGQAYWQSSVRGGRHTFQISVHRFNSRAPQAWFEAASFEPIRPTPNERSAHHGYSRRLI